MEFLINNQKSNYKIFLRRDVTIAEQFAASELQKYLEKVTGKRFPIFEEIKGINSPILIVTEELIQDKSWQKEIAEGIGKTSKLREDGFLIQGKGNRIHWHANNQRGILYGVYHFLEKYVGIHWVHPGPSGEVITPCKELNIKDINDIEEPDFKIRGLCLISQLPHINTSILIDWLAKSRMNRLYLQAFVWDRQKDEIVPELRKRGMKIELSFRSIQYWLPPSLYEKHPDYFALYNGKRDHCDYSLRCASNKEAVRLYAKNALNWIEKHPEVDIIHLIIQDGYSGRECQCEGCKQMTSTQQFFKFFDAVVEILKEEGIQREISCRIYCDGYEPEKDRVYSEYGLFYDTFYRCDRHSIGEKCEKMSGNVKRNQPSFPDMPVNLFDAEMLKKWRKVAKKNLYVYENVGYEGYLSDPLPNFQVIERDLKLYQKLGIDGVICQSNLHHWPVYAPNLFIYSRLMWNAKQSNLLKRYCELSYSRASSTMFEYFKFLWLEKEKLLHQPGRLLANMRTQSLEKAFLLLKRAEKEAESPDTIHQISQQQIILQNGRLTQKLRIAFEEAEEATKTGDVQKAKEMASKVIECYLSLFDFCRVNMGKGEIDASRILFYRMRYFFTFQNEFLNYEESKTEEHIKHLQQDKEYEDHIFSLSRRSIVEWQMERENRGMSPDGIFGELMFRFSEGYHLLAALKGKIYIKKRMIF